MSAAPHRFGSVALVGRPNVGKSTLLNALIGQKISIVSPKPQTTRHRILGILTRPQAQLVFLDTPGLHGGHGRQLNRAMNRAALAALAEADVVVLVTDARVFGDDDAAVLEQAVAAGRPVVLVLNKIDEMKPRSRLLPAIEALSRRHAFAAIVPVSATRGENLEGLLAEIERLLPEGPPAWPEDQVTDRSERFLAAEIVRERLMHALHDELPYGVSVEIERWEESEGRITINAVIWVEREPQRKIVIGEGGARIKGVGRAARLALNELLGRRVHLELWVKVRENWADSEQALRQFGYD
ncbi:MAG: GTPase Era [Steroidobacteraceae bacterium]